MRAPIQLDLHLPDFDLPGTEPDTLFERLVEIARTAEDSGFSSISVMDHLHQIPGIGPPDHRMLEGNAMLAALAAMIPRRCASASTASARSCRSRARCSRGRGRASTVSTTGTPAPSTCR